MIIPGEVDLGEHGRNVHRQFFVVDEDGQLAMREETNPMMQSRDNISQILPNVDIMLESIIIDTKNDTYDTDSDLVEFQSSKSNRM